MPLLSLLVFESTGVTITFLHWHVKHQQIAKCETLLLLTVPTWCKKRQCFQHRKKFNNCDQIGHLQKYYNNRKNRIHSSLEDNQTSSSKAVETRNHISKVMDCDFCNKRGHNVDYYYSPSSKPNKTKID